MLPLHKGALGAAVPVHNTWHIIKLLTNSKGLVLKQNCVKGDDVGIVPVRPATVAIDSDSLVGNGLCAVPAGNVAFTWRFPANS